MELVLLGDLLSISLAAKLNMVPEDIDTIEITKDRVKIPNTYLTQYIKSRSPRSGLGC